MALRTTEAPPAAQGRFAGFALVAAAALLLSLLPPVQLLELKWLDRQFQLLRQFAPLPANQDIVIVAVDDDTPRQFGVPLAIMHRPLGTAFAGLAAAQPKGVAVDIALPETSFDAIAPGLDAALARGLLRLARAAPLVLGVTADSQGRPRPLHAPFAALAGADGTGYVLVPADADGVLRRFDEHLGAAGESVPTLAGQLARRLGVAPEAGLVDYALGTPFVRIPLQQVVAWQEAGETQKLQRAFGGKLVLVGSLLSFEDRHPVPVALGAWESDERMVHGVAVHAQQLRNLMEGRMIRPLAMPVAWLGLLAAALLWWLAPGRRAVAALALLLLALGAGGAAGLRAGVHLPVAAWALAAGLAVAARAAWNAWLGLREKRRLRAAFAGAVSPPVLGEILAGRLSPGVAGERRDVCVMFCDIRQFTRLSESLAPEDVTRLLNRYFQHMAQAIHGHGGTLDKFIGDGIMAFFGAPQASTSPCEDAFGAARAMLDALQRFNAEGAAEGRAPLACGIGLHFGAAVIGYVGAVQRYEYTAIGDTVNTASRIEGLTKELGWPLLVSDTVAQRLAAREELNALGEHPVKGRAAVRLFGWRPGENPQVPSHSG